MSTTVKVLLIVLGVIVLVGAIAAFVMFGPPKVGEKIAKPEFCKSCHVMEPEYQAYIKSTHGTVTNSCNDCHLPNTGFVRHWTADAYVGIRDVVEFNLDMIPETFKITPRSADWLEENCRRCHGKVVHNVRIPPGRRCWQCHRDVSHDIQGRQDKAVRQPIREDQ